MTRIEVPFDGAPDFHETPHYGAPVVRADHFAVFMADGTQQG